MDYTLDEFFADDARVAVGDSFRPLYDRNIAGFDAPHVVPGRTLIVHQDYEWGHVPWMT